MLGNASEWVSDVDEFTGKRIRRGGGFTNALKNCSVIYQSKVKPDFPYKDAGFRVVRDPVK
jgi:formylglycine-generating enzyme required for sulfatase activity